MLIVGYVFALRSERRLCAEVQVNLAYRWFCKLGIEDKIPDHSVFCGRGANASVRAMPCAGYSRAWWQCAFRRGWSEAKRSPIDASLIKADVDKTKRLPGDQPIAWPKAEAASHAVREYIAALDASGDENGGEHGGGSNEGGHRRKPPKEVSLTDPQATWVTRRAWTHSLLMTRTI